jgi:hypothetical protein
VGGGASVTSYRSGSTVIIALGHKKTPHSHVTIHGDMDLKNYCITCIFSIVATGFSTPKRSSFGLYPKRIRTVAIPL